MHIEKFTVCGRPYLRLVRSKRRLTRNGKPISGKELVLTLGAYSKYDDGKPDYLGRLRQSFRDGKPLIPALVPYVGEATRNKVTVTFEDGAAECFGEPKRLAATILDPVFAALGLDQCLASIKHTTRIRYDLQGIVRLLTYSRIIDPASKIATMRENGKWYKPLVSSPNEANVYDALTLLEASRRQILRRMNTGIARGAGRKNDLVFYDVTNFFFEIPQADPDDETEIPDADGGTSTVVEKGLRQYGVSKENRRQPIVQMGLFLDGDGVPISIEEFAGNTLDAQTLRTALDNTVGTFGMKRFILVADRGMYSGTNVDKVLDGGNGYIVSKSLLKSTAKERVWATGAEDWEIVREDFKCKSRIVTRKMLGEDGKPVLDKDGKEKTRKEKIVVYWSRAFCERQRHENRSFLEFVDNLRANPAGFRVTTAQSRSLRRFLKKSVVNTKTGEELDGTKLRAMIDDEKLDAYKGLMGYYQIVSSETELSSTEIIEKYHGLTQIEDQFREMKGTLETRPVYVRTREHVKAHLLVCFIALTMLRLVQRKILTVLPKTDKKETNWTYGISGRRVAEALREWQIDELPGEYFRILNATGDDIKTILKAFGMDIQPKIYTKGELRELKSSVNPF